MAEGGEVPKIIVDKYGTEKSVPPKENSSESSQTSQKTTGNDRDTSSDKAGGRTRNEGAPPKNKGKRKMPGDFVKGAFAGALADDILEAAGRAVINKGGEAARKFFSGKGKRRGSVESGGSTEKKEYGEQLTFTEIERRLVDPSTSKEQRDYLLKARMAAIDDIEDLEGGEYLERVRSTTLNLLRGTKWDEVGDKLYSLGDNFDKQLYDSGGRSTWRGLMRQALSAEAAKLTLLGIRKKEASVNRMDPEWYRRPEHRFTQERIANLEKIAQERHIFSILPDDAQNVVGAALRREDEYSIPLDDTQNVTEPARMPVRRGLNSALDPATEAHLEALRIFYGEREPSFALALSEFQRAERLGEFYRIEDHKLISDKLKSEEERRLFEIEVKIFNAMLVKRYGGAGTMEGVGKNEELKKISTPELVYLFKNMEGYLFAMQEIADIVVHRKPVGTLDFSLLDCQNETQLIEVMEQIDNIVAGKLSADGVRQDDSRILAVRAVNTALNTMCSFNVLEFYNSFWRDKTRYKSLESEATTEPGKEGVTKYDRLVAKPIQDALCPMDDFLENALKERVKKPIVDNLLKWAKTEMNKSGVFKMEDFDSVVVLGYGEDDIKNYWKLKTVEGRRVLHVPPVRPSRMFGSVLDDNKVNLTGGVGRVEFLKALAERQSIDFENIGMPSNACALYTVDAPDTDILKKTFRAEKPLGEFVDVMKALGSFDLGECMELIAWIYVGMAQAINPRSHRPDLEGDILFDTQYIRQLMGLPKSDYFDIIKYIKSLPQEKRIKW